MIDQLKFLTCGSVDDGKSTLIGHMLYQAKLIYTDQEDLLLKDSKKGSRDGKIDYSLLLDGLAAEREQGITIDVAFRYFTTEKRSFIVADTPGHEQYTRNMAVGASFADLAIILVDATKGIQAQTKRHTRICALMGIKHIVLAVNKMDMADYNESVFLDIKNKFTSFSEEFGFNSVNIIPLSATEGDNLLTQSANTPWFNEAPLLPLLETIEIEAVEIEAVEIEAVEIEAVEIKTSETTKDQESRKDASSFVMPIQRISRPDASYRGIQGQVESGQVSVGDTVTILPENEASPIKTIYLGQQKVNSAIAGQSVSIQLEREIDASRGSVATIPDNKLSVADMFNSTILWMDDSPLLSGRNYLIKLGTKLIPGSAMLLKHKIDINSGDKIKTDQLAKNELGVCDITLTDKIVFDKFDDNPSIGSFILIDRITNMTVACGTINHPLRRSTNVVWQDLDITKEERAKQKNQNIKTLWFTGLSGAGKSTLANALEKRLFALGKHTMLLDGDNVRHGLNKNLGFKEADRIENIRRVAEVAKLMNDAGLITIVSFISPFERDRENAKKIIGNEFIEIYLSTSLEECEKRDRKGLYKKARAGEIPNFTGISSPYEKPKNPDIEIDTSQTSIEDAVDMIIGYLEQYPK